MAWDEWRARVREVAARARPPYDPFGWLAALPQFAPDSDWARRFGWAHSTVYAQVVAIPEELGALAAVESPENVAAVLPRALRGWGDDEASAASDCTTDEDE